MTPGQPCLLLDQTLREGSQQAGARFGLGDRLRLLRLLEEFGHRLIEVGHPGISADHENTCRTTARAAREAQVVMHARAHVEEVRAASRAGADWVGIWASVNDVSLATKFGGRPVEAVWARVESAVREAARLGLRIRFTVEDASRTPWEAVRAVVTVALAAGAHRISLADTTGCWEPRACGDAVRRARAELWEDIEVHLHDDLGLAHANALAAMDAGARVVDVSALGIGERAGIVNSMELATSLRLLRGDTTFDLACVPELTRAVQEVTGYRVDALRPVTGEHVFRHVSAYHRKAVSTRASAYEFVPPELVGRVRTVGEGEPPARESDARDTPVAGRPFAKGASELRHHRDGPGVRWVMLDARVDPRTSLYAIQRHFTADRATPAHEGHVDSHAHHCDSAFLFWGDRPDGSGLTCEVEVGDRKATVHSPASVFIPAGIEHSYRHVHGRGTYTNIVLAPEYNASLLSSPAPESGPCDPPEIVDGTGPLVFCEQSGEASAAPSARASNRGVE